MTSTEALTKSAITLKGSAKLVKEFFFYGISSILYQRGIYPSEKFTRKQEYGLSILVPSDEKLHNFLDPLLKQIEYWLGIRELQRLVIVISDVATKDVLERWQFDIETDAEITDAAGAKPSNQKSDKKIRQEISNVIRQITASVTFLPLLECACSFDVLIYTGKDAEQPDGWTESGPCIIQNSTEVKLRSFSTSVHNVDTKVAYKNENM